MSNDSKKSNEIESEVYDEFLSTEVSGHQEYKQIDNKTKWQKITLLTMFIAVVILSLIIIMSQTQDQLFAKKSSHLSSSAAPSSSSSEAGKGSSGGGASGSTDDNNSSSSSGPSNHHSQVDPTHCDQPGYPSCYSIGYADGQNERGTGCPNGHSPTFCAGLDAGSEGCGDKNESLLVLTSSGKTLDQVISALKQIAPTMPCT